MSLGAALLVAIPGCGGSPGPTSSVPPRLTSLAGTRDQPGLFTQRLLLPAGFCGPLHFHDGELHGLVLRGALRLGLADSAGRLHHREYPLGSFVVVPAGRRHVEPSATDTEIHLSGIGPLGTVVVHSTPPGRCTERPDA